MSVSNKIGNLLRNYSPKIYYFITKSIILKATYRFRPKSIFIMDQKGSSFKEYISENNMNDRLLALKNGMDDYSKTTISTLYKRLLNYPEFSYGVKIKPTDNKPIGGLLEEEKIKINNSKLLKKEKIKIKTNHIDSSVFYFHHGLKVLPDKIQKMVGGGDFIDLGAFVGESALILNQYNYKKIFSVDMSKVSIGNYKSNMAKNNISEDKFEVLNYAISDTNGDTIKFADSGSSGLSTNWESNTKDRIIEVPTITLDSLIGDYKINPSFIKMDIEGVALDCLKSGITSLKKYRPVMSIAIYHNPIEFFEVKPYLEAELDDYTFIVRKLSNTTQDFDCHAETILLAYPN